MPVTLDPDAAAVFKAFQEAGRPAYETLTPPEAREFYLAARVVSNPQPIPSRQCAEINSRNQLPTSFLAWFHALIWNV